MSVLAAFDAHYARMPLVAILRGVRPDEVVEIGEALVDVGFGLIETPLNSPEPLESIARLSRALDGRALVGAGTVRRAAEVDAVAAAGGTLIVSPHADTVVIARAAALGLVSMPGFATPTEAFAALDAGASALKYFPAEAGGPVALKAMTTVLPKDARLLPVGGVTPDSLAGWRAAGANGAGLGSALYRPGMAAAEVAERGRAFVEAWRATTR